MTTVGNPCRTCNLHVFKCKRLRFTTGNPSDRTAVTVTVSRVRRVSKVRVRARVNVRITVRASITISVRFSFSHSDRRVYR